MTRAWWLFGDDSRTSYAHGNDGVSHGDPRLVEVDIAPAQAQNLSAPHSGHRREAPRRLEPGALHGFKESGEFRRLPALDRPCPVSARPRRLRPLGNVRAEDARVHCVAKSLVNDRVDIPDGLSGQGSTLPAVIEQIGVERVQHRGC